MTKALTYSLRGLAVVAAVIGAVGFSGAQSVRRSIAALSPSQITSLRAGVAAMKARPVTDPTSWAFQANIHGTLGPMTSADWNQCQHGTEFFLSWHRMYLYYFERILRASSGDPSLTLPYWNWSDPAQRILPDPFRNPATAANSLYEPVRRAGVNAGSFALADSTVTYADAFAYTGFSDFQSTLEGTPHGAVHVALGGLMGSVPTAANDPIFWLHHCNIDRLWKRWLDQRCCRRDPIDGPWRNQIFYFYDETGHRVAMTGAQVIDTATQLNYVYDDDPLYFRPLPPEYCRPWWWQLLVRVPLRRIEQIRLEKPVTRIPLPPGPLKMNSRALATGQQVMSIVLEDIRVLKAPDGYYEVYLNLPGGASSFNSRNARHIGNLDFFTFTEKKKGMTMRMKMSRSFDVPASLLAGMRGMSGGASLTFVLRTGLVTLDGKPVPPETPGDVSIGNVSIETKAVHFGQAPGAGMRTHR